ncbi:MAG: Ldh family oxidoreductase [Micromonosporaceae bacterium]
MTTTVAEARTLAGELLAATGMAPEHADRSAWAIVLADCWGLGSHGLMRLPHYLRRLVAGGCRPDAGLPVVNDTGPLLALDGEDGLGHWQVWRAAELAAKRCAEYGVAVSTVGRSSHCGALGIYTLPLIRAGYAGLVFSNGPAVMPPTGGDRPVVSTSPIAAGFPSGADGEHPAIVDLATSAVARGKIAQRAAAGEPLPEGWAYDSAGVPTTDPAAALAGMLAPLGGAKGFALAFGVEALTGGLVGPALSTDVVDMFAAEDASAPQRIGHLVVALDPARTSVDGGGVQRLGALAEVVRAAGGRTPGQRRTPVEEIADDAPLSIAPEVATELADWATRLKV